MHLEGGAGRTGLFFWGSEKLSPELLDRIRALADTWNHIEGRLKQAENSRRDVVHAAVNELRYAGRVIVDIWNLSLSDDADSNIELIEKKVTVAEQYLMNANHDITDGVCFVFHQKVSDLLEHVPRRRIRRGFANLDEFLERLDQANAIVTQSRESRPDRQQLYEQLETEFIPYLLENFEYLDYAERLAEARLRRSRWFAVAGFVVGAIGVVGSFASMVSLDGQCRLIHSAANAFTEMTTDSEICVPKETPG